MIRLHDAENKDIIESMPPVGSEAQAARGQLERVLDSPGFVRNERMSRFLRFVVERHLEGRDNELKESVIAVEVFGRRPDFNPKRDPIVRTEAARLRARLSEYYLNSGRTDSVFIELPKGGYAPVFRQSDVRAEKVTAKVNGPEGIHGRKAVWLVSGLVFAGVLAGISLTARLRMPPAQPETDYEQLTRFSDAAVAPALSPDGRMLAFIRGDTPFVSAGQIYLKLLPGGEPVQLTHDPRLKFNPVFAPNGSQIAYSVVDPRTWTWNTVTITVFGGGEPRPFLANASGLTWISDGRFLFSEIKAGMHMGL